MLKKKVLSAMCLVVVTTFTTPTFAAQPVIRQHPATVMAGEAVKLDGSNLWVAGSPTKVILKWQKSEYVFPINASDANFVVVAPFPSLPYDGDMQVAVSTANGESEGKTVRYKSSLKIDRVTVAFNPPNIQVTVTGEGFLVKDAAGAPVPAKITMTWPDGRFLPLTAVPQSETTIDFNISPIEPAADLRFKVEIWGKTSNEFTVAKQLFPSNPAVISKIVPSSPGSEETILIIGTHFDTSGQENTLIIRPVPDKGEIIESNTVKATSANFLEYKLPAILESYDKVSIAIKNANAAESNRQEFDLAPKSKNIQVDFRVGMQTSTNKGVEEDSNKLFHGNTFFYDLVSRFKLCSYFDLEARLDVGRKLVEGEKADLSGNEGTGTIFANAETVEGELSFYFKNPKWDAFYLRPATSFIATTDKEIEDDFYHDWFLGIGYEPFTGQHDRFRRSKMEIGYGYTNALDNRSRFISNLKLFYHQPGSARSPSSISKSMPEKGRTI